MSNQPSNQPKRYDNHAPVSTQESAIMRYYMAGWTRAQIHDMLTSGEPDMNGDSYRLTPEEAERVTREALDNLHAVARNKVVQSIRALGRNGVTFTPEQATRIKSFQAGYKLDTGITVRGMQPVMPPNGTSVKDLTVELQVDTSGVSAQLKKLSEVTWPAHLRDGAWRGAKAADPEFDSPLADVIADESEADEPEQPDEDMYLGHAPGWLPGDPEE